MPVSAVCETAASVNAALRESLGSGGICSAAANAKQSSSAKSSSLLQDDNKLNSGCNNSNEVDTLHDKLAASAKRVILSKVDYEEATNYGQSVLISLKSKYTVLTHSGNKKTPVNCSSNSGTYNKFLENGKKSSGICKNNGANGDSSADSNGINKSDSNGSGTSCKKTNNPNELPSPKRVLYSRENVRIGWKAAGYKWNVGVGMMNVGNTCYLNSTLQALFHVPSMANWLMSDRAHMERCESTHTNCIICAMAKTLHESQRSQSAIRPYSVYSKLKFICKHMAIGRQEDAHEFLRYLVDSMEKSYLSRFINYKELDQYSKETTPLNQILGGYLKSAVRCCSCNYVSVTYQHFQDLLLDIRKADTIDEALDGYFSRERLEDMGYKCEGCKKKVSATKQFFLEKAPITLCIQLKRFTILGAKLSRQITIKPRIDLTEYTSRINPNEHLTYRLVAMVTHFGASQHCGHYTAVGSTESGRYYNFDDSYVRPISMQNVCNTNAYIIFYELDTQPPKIVTSTQVSGAQATSVNQDETIKMNGHVLGESPRIIGPQLPPGFNSNSNTNGLSSVTSSSPLVNGGSKLILNRNSTPLSSTTPSSSSATTSSSNGGSNKIMIHFKNSNTSLVKTSAVNSSVTSASATSTSSNSPFDNLKNSSSNKNTTNYNKLNGLHLEESVSAAKKQVNNLKNQKPNKSSSDDDDDYKNEIVISSQIRNATPATLPSMPKLAVPSSSISSTNLTNGFAKKSPAPIKSLVPYGSETDDEADVCMTNSGAAAASSEQQQKSSSKWSSSSSSDNDNDANAKDIKPSSNGIKIKKPASSTTTANNTTAPLSKSPTKLADTSKRSSDTIDEIFNNTKRSKSTTNTTHINTTSAGISTLKKKSQNQQFTVTSTTKTTDSTSSDEDDDENNKQQTKRFKRSHSTPPSPPVVKTNSGLWQVTSLQPVTACVSPTTSMPPSSSSSTEKSPKNPKNPFATKPLVPGVTDNGKRVKKETSNKTFNGNGYQRNTTTNESTVSELLKQSHRGYGAPTLTWNGQQSEIDKEIISEAREQRQRDWEDEEENEMDRGRQKTVKAPKDPYATTRTPGYNPFQEQENQKRWKRYHHMGGGSGGYRHHNKRNKFKFQRFQHKFSKKYMNGGGGNSVLNMNRRSDS